MVEFRSTMGGYEVRVDGQLFGHIDKDGFFTDPTVVKDFMRVSSNDLRKIADKTDEYKRTETSIRDKGGFLGQDHHKGCSVTAIAYK